MLIVHLQIPAFWNFLTQNPLLEVQIRCSILDYTEIAEDECEIVADVDLWDELTSAEGVDDVEIAAST